MSTASSPAEDLYKSYFARTRDPQRVDSSSAAASAASDATQQPPAAAAAASEQKPSYAEVAAQPPASELEDVKLYDTLSPAAAATVTAAQAAAAAAPEKRPSMRIQTSSATMPSYISAAVPSIAQIDAPSTQEEEEDFENYYHFQKRNETSRELYLNFPPIIKPLIFHDLDVDVPDHKLLTARLAFFCFFAHFAILVYDLVLNIISGISVFTPAVPSDHTAGLLKAAGAVQLVTGLFFAPIFAVFGFLLLYWPIYNACRTSNSLRYLYAFSSLNIMTLSAIVMALGIPFVSPGFIWGVWLAAAATHHNVFIILLHFANALLWTAVAGLDIFTTVMLVRNMKDEGRSLRLGIVQLRRLPEIHRGTDRRERINWNFKV